MHIFVNIVFTVIVALSAYLLMSSTHDEYRKGISHKIEYVFSWVVSVVVFVLCVVIIWTS